MSQENLCRKKGSCVHEWEVKFVYGIAFTLAVFETKRLFVLALEIFAEWQVIRFAGGFQPVAFTLMDVMMGLSCALITIRTVCKYKLLELDAKTKKVLKRLSMMIAVCIIMNSVTLVSIGYHISVRQKTLVDVFNASMQLYVSTASYKSAIDEIQFMLQCCGHTSYTDWFLLDWQKVDYASREEMSMQSRISDEDYRDRSVPFSCCNLHAMTPCIHTEMTDDKTINANGCIEVISPILLRIVIVAHVMTGILIITQVLLGYLITRVLSKVASVRTSYSRMNHPTMPFAIINACPRTYVPRLVFVKKSTRRRRNTLLNVFKENRKTQSLTTRSNRRVSTHGKCTVQAAKIKPSVHEEHRISVKCIRDKRTW